jgi:putative CocE/NonD family hydrolase
MIHDSGLISPARPSANARCSSSLWLLSFLLGCSIVADVHGESRPDESDTNDQRSASFSENYVKREYRVPMRDGVHLFTAVYAPRDRSRSYPILLRRTPYGCHPYGEEQYAALDLVTPSALLTAVGYIFVVQDVRGCFMSEGEWVHMRPFADGGADPSLIDESTDTYDTIEWLLANVANHNRRVGMWGASYPGFYAAAALVDSHPSLKAVSPAAPQADWFFEDVHQNGAIRLADVFGFLVDVGWPRPGPSTRRSSHHVPSFEDGYRFFLDLGSLRNIDRAYFRDRISIWREIVAHPNYDHFWRRRNLLPHLRDIRPATLTVGGWFDESNLYGTLNVFRTLRSHNAHGEHSLVIGPWQHTGWESEDDDFGDVRFGRNTGLYFQRRILVPFLERHLREGVAEDQASVEVFNTGVNEWRVFSAWPPAAAGHKTLFLHSGGRLTPSAAMTDDAVTFTEFVSDPADPVPFTALTTAETPASYMTEDQRFVASRPDVLVFRTSPLVRDLTIAGPITADLWVTTSGSDADWIVKIIDAFPDGSAIGSDSSMNDRNAGYQMLVRGGVIRGRFRDSFSNPEPFTPNKPTRVAFDLLDVLHTFRRGHRLMVQIQSSWFPLIDRNPQRYVPNIFLADPEAFVTARHRVLCSRTYPSQIRFVTIPLPERTE